MKNILIFAFLMSHLICLQLKANTLNNDFKDMPKATLFYYDVLTYENQLLLAGQPYSQSLQSGKSIGIRKQYFYADHVSYVVQLGLCYERTKFDYLQNSAFNNEYFANQKISLQNPELEAQWSLTQITDKFILENNYRDYFYIRFVPGLFDQHTSMQSSRLIEGSSMKYGYLRWLHQNNVLFSLSFFHRIGDRLVDGTSNTTIYRSNAVHVFSLTLEKHQEIRNDFSIMIGIGYENQLDRFITESDGQESLIKGFSSLRLFGRSDYLIFNKKIFGQFDIQDIPSRIYQSGEMTFNLSHMQIYNVNFGIYL